MEKIIITPIEKFGTIRKRIWIDSQGVEKVNRILTPIETMMELANEKAGIKDSLVWYGYEYHFDVNTKNNVFLKV